MSLITDDQVLELITYFYGTVTDIFWCISQNIVNHCSLPGTRLKDDWSSGTCPRQRRDALVVQFPCTRSATVSTMPWQFVCTYGVPTNGRARVGNFTKPYDLGLSLTGEYLQTRIASDYGRPQLQVPPLILNEILIWKLQPLKSVWILYSLVVFGIWT